LVGILFVPYFDSTAFAVMRMAGSDERLVTMVATELEEDGAGVKGSRMISNQHCAMAWLAGSSCATISEIEALSWLKRSCSTSMEMLKKPK
jgi:hypothetical protein